MSSMWVDNIDKSVEALVEHIEKLKVRANDVIPKPMKINKITSPSIASKSVQSQFKIGLSYYERDCETIEQVDQRLEILKHQHKADKELIEKEAKSNIEAIENNKKVVAKITQIMQDIGIPNQYTTSYFKTNRSRTKTTETHKAGYLGDLSRNIATMDDSAMMIRKADEALAACVRYADQLKQKIHQEQQAKEKVEKDKKAVQVLARLQVKYGLDENSYWTDVLDALDKKDKYFMLARAMEDTRGDWSEGFWRVEDAISQFVVETEEDKEIEADVSSYLDGEYEDGRCFRDCEYSYSVLYGKVDADLLKDYETLQEYYSKY